MTEAQTDLYLTMPLDRVRADAIHGVSAACEAWRKCDPVGASRELGRIVEAGEPASPAVAAAIKSDRQTRDETRERQTPILDALRDFFEAHGRRGRSGPPGTLFPSSRAGKSEARRLR